MMNRKVCESQRWVHIMWHSGRARREKDEGRDEQGGENEGNEEVGWRTEWRGRGEWISLDRTLTSRWGFKKSKRIKSDTSDMKWPHRDSWRRWVIRQIFFCYDSDRWRESSENQWGIFTKGGRCDKRLRAKTEGGQILEHTRWCRWRGERGYLRRGKWMGDERSVSGRGECVLVKL